MLPACLAQGRAYEAYRNCSGAWAYFPLQRLTSKSRLKYAFTKPALFVARSTIYKEEGRASDSGESSAGRCWSGVTEWILLTGWPDWPGKRSWGDGVAALCAVVPWGRDWGSLPALACWR